MAALASLFSATVIQELARQGRSRTFARLVRESGIAESLKPTDPLRIAFEAAFRELRRAHGGEYVFKATIVQKILMGRHTLNTAAMLTEFRVGGCKADVVILNGTSVAYEIKSDRDRLDRLHTQVSTYLRAFASVNVIASDRHAESILKQTPSEVGVLRLTRRGRISTVRRAADEPARVDPLTIFGALQQAESKRILRTLGHSIPDVPNTRLHAELRRMFVRLKPSDVHEATVSILRATRSHRALSGLLRAVPNSLQAATLATRLRRADHERFCRALDTQVVEALQWD